MQDHLGTIWGKTLTIIKGELNAPTFKTWFKNTNPLSLDERGLVVSVPSPFAKEWLESRYTSLLRFALQEVVGEETPIAFTVQEEKQAEDSLPPRGISQTALLEKNKSAFVATPLNPKYTFDSFVIGNSNRFAHAAALAVAENPHKQYNPLFLYGGVGLGKTHLLQAIAHYVLAQHTSLKVKYVSTEKFTNDFINSIRDRGKISGFQKRYRGNDVLLVDDIQFLENKEATQEEFFHTFNTLYEASKQIVISSDRPPRDIATLEDRLRSRFEWGLITDIQPPDLETRIAILRKKAAAENLTLPGEVLEFIASRIQTNIRELEGALIRVIAYATLNKSNVDVDLANHVLKDIFPRREFKPISVQKIQNEVCRYYNISRIELLGNKRPQAIAFPRQVAMYLTRELTDLSLPKIGGEFGGRDHTTVLHATAKIEKLINERREVYNQIQELTRLINKEF